MVKLTIKDIVEIPEKVTIVREGPLLKVTGPEGTIEKRMTHSMVKINIGDKQVEFSLKNGTKREKMMLKTFKAHLKNMINGVGEKYTYKLKICSSHFPMTITKEGSKITIKNFLGEKIPRVADIVGDTNVEIKGEDIIVTNINKEKAGQTAANIERATRMTSKDRRRFQDGIFITEKAGVEL